MDFPFTNNTVCCLISPAFVCATGSEEKTSQASVTHAASSHTSQSQSADVTDNDDEPIGDRWDEDEDWGSLEVGSLHFTNVE